MSILLSMHLIAKKRVMGKEKKNVVISDGTLFCRLWREEEEEALSKWNKLINHMFCLCYNLFWSCYANVVLYGAKTVSVNLL